MYLITDIKKIERLSEEKIHANLKFRQKLKYFDLDEKKLDAIVHRLFKEVSEAIDCGKCANCCKTTQTALDEEDIKRLATHLSMFTSEFTKKYLEMDEFEGGYKIKGLPCTFLSRNSCTVYSARPEACRSYPHLQKDDFVSRTLSVISNCSVCPVVYNVFELLKCEISIHDGESYLNSFTDPFIED